MVASQYLPAGRLGFIQGLTLSGGLNLKYHHLSGMIGSSVEMAKFGAEANLEFAWSTWLSWRTDWVQTPGFPCPRPLGLTAKSEAEHFMDY
jgi:hypothetical protein